MQALRLEGLQNELTDLIMNVREEVNEYEK